MILGRWLIVFLLCIGFGAGCGDSEPPPADAPSVVEGVVTEVDAAGLGEVNAFTVKDGDDTYEIAIDPERDYGFNLDHLNEHRTTGDPVRVELETKDGELVAVEILDA